MDILKKNFFELFNIEIAIDVNRLRWDNKTLSYRNYALRDEQIERWMEKQEETYEQD